MVLGMELPTRQFPSLVQLCQRVAGSHVDHIYSLGDDISYSLVKPVLERCNAEQLLRIEHASPHLQKDTPQIWKDLCFQKYSIAMERYTKKQIDELESWRDQYFFLREEEAKRLEEASIKLRSQRLEAEERKKEREVKITDRMPPPKRQRTGGWSTNVQPKTLFQKTKTEASRLQKNMYNARIIPPNSKASHTLSKFPGATLPLLPPSSDPSRVTVNTVYRRLSSASTLSSTSASSSKPIPVVSPSKSCPPIPTILSSTGGPSNGRSPMSTIPSTPSEPRPLKPPTLGKKDPMAALFVPKRRAYSQRPS